MNIDLAMKALEDAKRSPENFNMATWFGCTSRTLPEFTKDRENYTPPCGTTACYAGFVGLRVAPVGTRVMGSRLIFPDGSDRWADDYAQEALDITEGQGLTLFYLGNIERVERALNYLADNPDAGEFELYEHARYGDGQEDGEDDDWAGTGFGGE